MGYFEDLKTQASSDTGALLESASAGLDRSELSHSTDIDSSYYRVDTYTLDTLDVTDVGRAHEEVSYDDDGTRVTRLVLDSGDVVATARETTTETDEGTSVSVSVSFDERYTVYGSLDEYAPHEQDPLSYEFSKNFDSDGKIMSMETSGLTVRTFEYSEGGKFAWEDLQKVAGHFMWRMRNAGNSSWQTVWNDIDWYGLCSDGKVFASGGGQDMEMSGTTDEIWDVDRKFFYGYWRDCADARRRHCGPDATAARRPRRCARLARSRDAYRGD